MSKSAIWALIIVVVIIGGYYMFKGNNSVDTYNINNTGSPEEVKNTSGKKMAFSEFIKNPNGSYKCEVKQVVSDMENSGTVYVSDGKMKGDYTTIAEGRTMKISFMMSDGYSYTWGDMMPGAGFKMKIPEGTSTSTNINASGTYSWNAEQIGDYDCEPWIADSSTFKLPTGVTFKDFSANAMMQGTVTR